MKESWFYIDWFNFWYFFFLILGAGAIVGLYFLLRNKDVKIQKAVLFSLRNLNFDISRIGNDLTLAANRGFRHVDLSRIALRKHDLFGKEGTVNSSGIGFRKECLFR